MILLSFDTEEFDVPREHGVDFPLDEAMKVSVYGTNRILDCLKKNGVKATFFCTSNFAENAPARSANASSQTKSFINAALPIFHFPLIIQVGSQRAELEFAIVLEPSYRTVPEMEYRLS